MRRDAATAAAAAAKTVEQSADRSDYTTFEAADHHTRLVAILHACVR